MVFHILTPMIHISYSNDTSEFQITPSAYQLWKLSPVPRLSLPIQQFRANGFETANIAVKVSEGQLYLYLVDHKIISVTLGTDWGWPGFRGGTRKPFAFNRLRLASVKNVSHALKLQCISTRVDLP
jgi:hypothetical protein